MENLTFLPHSLAFIALNSVSLLTLNVKGIGKYLSFVFSLLASVAFLVLLFGADKFEMSNLFVIEGTRLLVLKIASVLNIFMLFINGFSCLEKVKSSLIMNFMFLGGIFLVGAQELITFYVAMETIALLGYALVALSDLKFSREAAVKYLIQGSVISVIFLLGVSLYLGATGSLSLVNVTVVNQELYALALIIFVLVAAFKLGAFPFHAWMADVYSNVSGTNLATNFFISKMIIGFKFITLIQVLLLELDPHYQGIIIRVIQVIAVVSAFYGNIIAVVQSQFKRIIAYSSLAHTGYIFMFISLNPSAQYDKQLIAFFTMYSLTATGVLLILNHFLKNGNDGLNILKAGFYRNRFLSILLVVFILSLAGIPLTSGFALKYMLFTNFFKEGFTLEATSIFISSIIGLAYYIRFVSELFTESSENCTNGFKVGLGERFVHIVIFAAILVIGVAPGLFFNLN